jgi:cyclase
MEDILFIDCHPYLADGDPDVIQRVLADVKMLQPAIVVPGHGPVGKLEHLDILHGYIAQLKALACHKIQQGASEDELDKIPIPQEYQHYIFPVFFSANLKFIYQRQLKAKNII